ncbi:UNVERIFIED_CONTAM: hypothetical protein GTU68_059510 [Idotea baltica]|nr:hypothetical protein [Idotea baltica]
MSMEGRMTVCNMSIEAGAKAGMIAPDETTFAYLEGRENAPKGAAWEQALSDWRALPTDADAVFDAEVTLDGSSIQPQISWGTNPGQVAPLSSLKEISVDTIFIGSCTNSRIEDLRAAAEVAKGRKVASSVRTLVVPGSFAVKRQAEAEGLHTIFTDAGFDWREPGCSMCLAMNPDKLVPGERSASTSNRNFEGRQGRGGRTHLVSPAVAAASAIAGHFAEPTDLQ